MINANELRIGNYVNYYQVYIRVLSINSPHASEQERYDGKYILEIGSPDSFNVSINEVSPIPLTEELLLRFGFEAIQDGYYKKGEITWNIYNEQCHFIDWELPHIQHLHQLQNLYFALTGQELTLK